jgi:hypothetical protein
VKQIKRAEGHGQTLVEVILSTGMPAGSIPISPSMARRISRILLSECEWSQKPLATTTSIPRSLDRLD